MGNYVQNKLLYVFACDSNYGIVLLALGAGLYDVGNVASGGNVEREHRKRIAELPLHTLFGDCAYFVDAHVVKCNHLHEAQF